MYLVSLQRTTNLNNSRIVINFLVYDERWNASWLACLPVDRSFIERSRIVFQMCVITPYQTQWSISANMFTCADYTYHLPLANTDWQFVQLNNFFMICVHGIPFQNATVRNQNLVNRPRNIASLIISSSHHSKTTMISW